MKPRLASGAEARVTGRRGGSAVTDGGRARPNPGGGSAAVGRILHRPAPGSPDLALVELRDRRLRPLPRAGRWLWLVGAEVAALRPALRPSAAPAVPEAAPSSAPAPPADAPGPEPPRSR
jgi:hypothetical protein